MYLSHTDPLKFFPGWRDISQPGDPYLWVRSLREIHSITVQFFLGGGFFCSSVTLQKSLKAKKTRSGCAKGRESTDHVPGEGSALSPPPSPKCWWPSPSLLMGFEAARPSSWVIILLNGDIFNPLNIVYPCSQPSARVHTNNSKIINLQKASCLRKQPRNWE